MNDATGSRAAKRRWQFPITIYYDDHAEWHAKNGYGHGDPGGIVICWRGWRRNV